MQERNVIGSVSAAAIAPICDFYEKLLPFLALAFVLIVVDSRFGVLAAIKRGEKIRPSRKWRRAINKMVDYVCWVTLAGLMGETFGTSFHIPLLSMIMLAIVYGVELTSIFNNYFEYKGEPVHINIWKFLARTFNRPEIEDSITTKKDGSKRIKK